MGYALTIGRVNVWAGGPEIEFKDSCTCEEARYGCMPAFVFSVPGQVRFRVALKHLKTCQRRDCRSLRANVYESMTTKLKWLLNEERLLGCVHIQPTLFGSRRIVVKRADFPAIAHHLAHCPKDSCAQLRRALLLKIRDELRS